MTKTLLLTCAAAALCLALPDTASAGKGKKDGADHPHKVIRQYDTNGNGIIDGAEIDAVRKAFEAAPTGPLKQFDTNNDGKLDDAEIGAMKVKPKGKKKKNATT